MFKRFVDIVALVMLLHAEDMPGVEAAVSWMFQGKTLQKLLRLLSKFYKGLPYRFESVSYLLRLEVSGVLYLSAKPRRLSFVMCYESELGIVDHDLLFCRLDAQDICDIAGRDGVAVRFEHDEALGVTYA